MKINFTNEEFKIKALNSSEVARSRHSVADAVMLLLKDVSFKNLSNLCKILSNMYPEYTEEEWYLLTQNNIFTLTNGRYDLLKERIKDACYKCIENGYTLGNQMTWDNGINMSEWISHALYTGKLSGELARMLCFSENDISLATQHGLLHDIGRKFDHTIMHTIKGFEFLVDYDNGSWSHIAPSCLTHSFLGGQRWGNNEVPEISDFFMIDDSGNAICKTNDDISDFLNNYNYSLFDIILNVADLMATSRGIVSPMDRICDIEKRRNNIFVAANRAYFFAMFNNMLIFMLDKMGVEIPSDVEAIIIKKDMNLPDVREQFKKTSDYFYSVYKSKRRVKGISN